MSRGHVFAAVVAVLLLVPNASHACQDPEEQAFFLASGSNEETRVQPGCYQVCIHDLVPNVDYLFNQSVVRVDVEVPKSIRAENFPSCSSLREALEAPPTEESQVPAWVGKLETERRTCNDSTLVTKADTAIADTRNCLNPSEVTRRSGVEVEVRRVSGKSWTFQLLPPDRKVWYTSYGIQAVPSEDERYFTQSIDPDADGNPQFELRRERTDSQDYDADALVLFTRLWGDRSARFGLSAGLGLDSNELAFFFGPSLAVSDFLFITGGVAFHPQQRLLGSFEPGQVVSTDLTSDSLVGDTHDFNGFLGVTLSFGKNPFKKDGDDKTPATKPAPSGGGSGGGS